MDCCRWVHNYVLVSTLGGTGNGADLTVVSGVSPSVDFVLVLHSKQNRAYFKLQ